MASEPQRFERAKALARILYDEAAAWGAPLDTDGSGDLFIAYMLALLAIDFLSNSDAAPSADDPHPAVPGQMATSEKETENGF